MDNFPVLYGYNSNGKKKYWKIQVSRDNCIKIIIEHGYIDTDKPIISEKVVTNGKNIGRANETTPYDQAVSEARSKWTKKVNEGMRENVEVNTDDIINKMGEINLKSEKIFPMLALNYSKRGKDIIFPCYAQAKLDGVRCVYNNSKMSSRQARDFKHMLHIKDELRDCPYILDGELYSDELDFQELTGLVKKVKVSEADIERSKKIHLVVYDMIKKDDYTNRLKELQKYFSSKKFKYVELLKTEECVKEDDIKKFHDKYVKQGYEGLILRNKTGDYQEGYRSKNLQKYKEFMDDEFEIVGFMDGTGIESGLVIWSCKTKEGNVFQVRPKGTHDERRVLFSNGKDYIGKKLTVVYQELTNDKIPRFPTTMYGGLGDIRDYE